MSIVIVLITVLTVAGIIVNLKSKKDKSMLAKGEITVPTEEVEVPTMKATKKPKTVKQNSTIKKSKTQVTKKQNNG
tara:strand:- start:1983 stop:2210 length:228 start_codon:yes stop_codon:yes gene_type:complete